MRKMIFALALVPALVGGCATTQPGGTPTPLPTFGDIVEQVQAITRQACTFVPTVQTVLNIANLGLPALSTAGAIAQAICDALAMAPPQARRSTDPNRVRAYVAGVAIRGEFR